jgi:murein DD-endopeptidase MepM/ murein hydrolase activator NlpD
MLRTITCVLFAVSPMVYANGYWEQVYQATERARISEHALAQPVENAITSSFGMRFHPILEKDRLHRGVDYSSTEGAPFKVVYSGRVLYSEMRGDLGLTIAIDHGNGLITRYAHASTSFVAMGDYVQKGDAIGEVGTTGMVTGPHLHFEVIKNGEHIDPDDVVVATDNIEFSGDHYEAVLTKKQREILLSHNPHLTVKNEPVIDSGVSQSQDIAVSKGNQNEQQSQQPNHNPEEDTRIINPAETYTTWRIASELIEGKPYTVYQALGAILKLNPNLFIKGDMHLRQKGEMTLPTDGEIAQISKVDSKKAYYATDDITVAKTDTQHHQTLN